MRSSLFSTIDNVRGRVAKVRICITFSQDWKAGFKAVAGPSILAEFAAKRAPYLPKNVRLTRDHKTGFAAASLARRVRNAAPLVKR